MPTADQLQPFECCPGPQSDIPWVVFSILEREKSHKDSSRANKEAEEPQECSYWPKNGLLKLLSDKAHCREATPNYFLCLVSHAWPFCIVFQKFLGKWLISWHGGTNSLWTISWLSKKQISMLLIFDLLMLGILALESLECAIPCSGAWVRLYSNTKWGSFSMDSKKSTQLSLLMSFWSCLRFLGTSFEQMFLIPNSLVNIWWTVMWLKFNFVPVILTVNRWFAYTGCSYFCKCLKAPKHLGPWQNTVSVGLPKFWKRFRYTMSKSEA